MRNLLLAIMVCLSVRAGAQVLVYKIHVTSTVNGEAVTARRAISGYFVVDVNSGDSKYISALAKTKGFQVYDISWNIRIITGSVGREFTVYSYADSYADDNGFLNLDATMVKGQNTVMDIGDPTSYWRIPRSLSYVERAIYPSGSNTPTDLVEEDSGTFTLDLKTTQSCNLQFFNLDQASSVLTTQLVASGYHQD